MREWAVNLRLKANGVQIPKEAKSWILKTFAQNCGTKSIGYYTFLPDGSLAFVGCYAYSPFQETYGWFPKEFPYDDPYQSVYKGMKSEEFAAILKQMGFKEVKFEEVRAVPEKERKNDISDL